MVETNAKTAYTSEIVSPAASTEYEDEIGLMYVSDYMYAASPTYWSYSGHNSSDATKDYSAAINENWMCSGVYEWSIARNSDIYSYSFFVRNMGYVDYTYVSSNYGIRPVFNLKSSVVWEGGDGSQNSPYRVGL